ncbi:MAG: ExbD/TolR family protein [Kofleriaceae bacterium]
MRLLATTIACTLVACGGSRSTPAPTETQTTTEASAATARPAGPPVVAIDAGRVLLDGVEIVKVADVPPGAETIAPLRDALGNSGASSDRGLVLRADKDTSAIVINAVLGTANAAGYSTISLCPRTSEPDETCSQLVLSERRHRE